MSDGRAYPLSGIWDIRFEGSPRDLVIADSPTEALPYAQAGRLVVFTRPLDMYSHDCLLFLEHFTPWCALDGSVDEAAILRATRVSIAKEGPRGVLCLDADEEAEAGGDGASAAADESAEEAGGDVGCFAENGGSGEPGKSGEPDGPGNRCGRPAPPAPPESIAMTSAGMAPGSARFEARYPDPPKNAICDTDSGVDFLIAHGAHSVMTRMEFLRHLPPERRNALIQRMCASFDRVCLRITDNSDANAGDDSDGMTPGESTAAFARGSGVPATRPDATDAEAGGPSAPSSDAATGRTSAPSPDASPGPLLRGIEFIRANRSAIERQIDYYDSFCRAYPSACVVLPYMRNEQELDEMERLFARRCGGRLVPMVEVPLMVHRFREYASRFPAYIVGIGDLYALLGGFDRHDVSYPSQVEDMLYDLIVAHMLPFAREGTTLFITSKTLCERLRTHPDARCRLEYLAKY